jgi:hypothetical protein
VTAELFVSLKTVETHPRNTFRKLAMPPASRSHAQWSAHNGPNDPALLRQFPAHSKDFQRGGVRSY